MSITRTLSSLCAGSVALLVLLLGQAQAQQTPQVSDDNYAYGNAPYANPYPQNKPSLIPFLNETGVTPKWQLFAPARISDYGTGPKPKNGWFFSYERLYWSMSKPERSEIGNNDANGYYKENSGTEYYEQSTLDTGMLTAKAGWGNRWETGYIDTNNHGWLVSVIDHVFQTQDFQYENATVLFNDPNNVLNGFLLGPTGYDADLNNNGVNGRDGSIVINPVTGVMSVVCAPTDEGDAVTFIPRFSVLHVYNRQVLNGTEIMRLYRAPQFHNGGVVDFLYGARWFQADDTFEIKGYGGVLDSTDIHNRVQNNLIGPQIGLRYGNQRGRWTVSFEGRFMAAANFESFHQTSYIASNFNAEQALLNAQSTASTVPVYVNPVTGLEQIPTGQSANEIRNAPANLNAMGSNAAAFATKFAPLVEFRANANYQITRAFGVTIGYTALYTNGLNRASDTINYTLPTMGLQNTNVREGLVVQGLSLGFTFNR